MKKYTHLTIEPSKFTEGEFVVYGWSTYPKTSVLAGQPSKTYIESFSTIEKAEEKYPTAKPSAPYNPNTFHHLPDQEMSAYEEESYFYGNDE